MPLRITQKECDEATGSNGGSAKTGLPHHCGTMLKVEGTLYLEDAELLEKICRDIGVESGRHITLDLADISFLDSDGASVLSRLKHEQGVSLEGLHLFIAKVIELTEAEATVSEYLRKSSGS
jgi:anti-anti-sigma regulatory factor